MTDKNVLNEEELNEVAGGAAELKVIGVASVLVSGLNIRSNPNTKATLMGQANAPAKYDVYEITQNEGYIWYRIAKNMWIANDGNWVSFTAK